MLRHHTFSFSQPFCISLLLWAAILHSLLLLLLPPPLPPFCLPDFLLTSKPHMTINSMEQRVLSSSTFASLNVAQNARFKAPLCLRWAQLHDIDFLLLQEVGASALKCASDFGYVPFTTPKARSGCAILINKALAPLVSSVHRLAEGRLISICMAIGSETVSVSCIYAISGLDFLPHNADHIQEMKAIYEKYLRFSKKHKAAVLMGDFNETSAPIDCSNPAARPFHNRCGSLLAHSFNDSFRLLHPTAPGYTHFSVSQLSSARLDKCLVRNAVVVESRVVNVTPCKTDHFILFSKLRFPSKRSLTLPRPVFAYPLPKVFGSSAAQKADLVEAVQVKLGTDDLGKGIVEALDMCNTKDSLSHLLSTVNHIIFPLACKHLGTYGLNIGPPEYRSARSTIKAIGRARREGADLFCARFNPFLNELRAALDVSPSTERKDIFNNKTQQRLRDLRKIINHPPPDPTVKQRRLWVSAPVDAAHEALRIHESPRVQSVIDPISKRLVTNRSEVERVLKSYFSRFFGAPGDENMPEEKSADMPPWVSTCFKPLEHINPSIYDSLMAPFTSDELKETLSTCEYRGAPGPDKISPGLWKALVSDFGEADVAGRILLSLCNCILRQGFPTSLKEGILSPVYKSSSEDKATSNLRPITLLNGVLRITNAMITQRLCDIFEQHPVLSAAQQSFVRGTSSIRNLLRAISALEQARNLDQECHILLMDLSKCYDTIPHWAIPMALRRIRMPQPFIDFVASSLSGGSVKIRTAFGFSSPITIHRGIPQGSPLSPLLCAIFLDALLVGFGDNPLFNGTCALPPCVSLMPEGHRDGFQMIHNHRDRNEGLISASGYADDIAAVSSSAVQVWRQLCWAMEFAWFFTMEWSVPKFHYIAVKGATDLTISVSANGIDISPVSNDKIIKHMGIRFTSSLDFAAQIRHLSSVISLFRHTVITEDVPTSKLPFFFNTFLAPILEYSFRVVPVSRKQLQQWDTAVTKAVTYASASAGNIKPAIASLIAGIKLPSRLFCEVAVTELLVMIASEPTVRSLVEYSMEDPKYFPRVARKLSFKSPFRHIRILYTLSLFDIYVVTNDGRSLFVPDHIVFGGAGRISHEKPPAQNIFYNSHKVARDGGRMVRIGGRMILHKPIFFGSYRQFPAPPAIPFGITPSTPSGLPVIFTDASFDLASSSGSFAFMLVDDSVNMDAFLHTRSREDILRSISRLHGTSGMRVNGVHSSTEVELMGIIVCLMSIPVQMAIEICTDSKASIDAINRYASLPPQNARKRLRCQASTLLSAYHSLVQDREAQGVMTSLRHVKAHTLNDDFYAQGNRAVDFLAGFIANCDRFPICSFAWHTLASQDSLYRVVMNNALILGDPRARVRTLMGELDEKEWRESKTQHGFITSNPIGTRFLLRMIKRARQHIDPCFLAAVVAGTLPVAAGRLAHGHRLPPDVRAEINPICPHCDDAEDTILHLFSCPSILDRLDSSFFSDVCNAWMERGALSLHDRVGAFDLRALSFLRANCGAEISIRAYGDLIVDCIKYALNCWMISRSLGRRVRAADRPR